jgi:hypothetical protein
MTDSVDPEERYYQERLQTLRREALPNTRSIAEKWSGTLGTLLGLLGGSVIIVTRDIVRKLATPAAVWVGILFALGLALAATAIVAAAMAAQGRFRRVGPAGSAKEQFERETRSAQKLLFISRLAVGGSMILLVAVLFITWYGPVTGNANNAKIKVLVLTNDTVSCGEILQLNHTHLVLVDEHAKKTTITTAKVRVLTQVSICP